MTDEQSFPKTIQARFTAFWTLTEEDTKDPEFLGKVELRFVVEREDARGIRLGDTFALTLDKAPTLF